MALGLPIGILHGPSSAIYAFIAYVAGVSGAVLGFTEPGSVERSALRKVLLFGLPPIAAYAFYQRSLHLPGWDRTWLQATQLTSIGDPEQGKIRAFGTLNSPGALAPLLALSLLCYLTVRAGAADRRRRRRPHRRRAVADVRAIGLGGAHRGRASRTSSPRAAAARGSVFGSAAVVVVDRARPVAGQQHRPRRRRPLPLDQHERRHLVRGAVRHRQRDAADRARRAAGPRDRQRRRGVEAQPGLEPARPRQRLPQPALPGRASSASRS